MRGGIGLLQFWVFFWLFASQLQQGACSNMPPCVLQFADLKQCSKDSALLDAFWKCRACQRLAAEHKLHDEEKVLETPQLANASFVQDQAISLSSLCLDQAKMYALLSSAPDLLIVVHAEGLKVKRKRQANLERLKFDLDDQHKTRLTREQLLWTERANFFWQQITEEKTPTPSRLDASGVNCSSVFIPVPELPSMAAVPMDEFVAALLQDESMAVSGPESMGAVPMDTVPSMAVLRLPAGAVPMDESVAALLQDESMAVSGPESMGAAPMDTVPSMAVLRLPAGAVPMDESVADLLRPENNSNVLSASLDRADVKLQTLPPTLLSVQVQVNEATRVNTQLEKLFTTALDPSNIKAFSADLKVGFLKSPSETLEPHTIRKGFMSMSSSAKTLAGGPRFSDLVGPLKEKAKLSADAASDAMTRWNSFSEVAINMSEGHRIRRALLLVQSATDDVGQIYLCFVVQRAWFLAAIQNVSEISMKHAQLLVGFTYWVTSLARPATRAGVPDHFLDADVQLWSAKESAFEHLLIAKHKTQRKYGALLLIFAPWAVELLNYYRERVRPVLLSDRKAYGAIDNVFPKKTATYMKDYLQSLPQKLCVSWSNMRSLFCENVDLIDVNDEVAILVRPLLRAEEKCALMCCFWLFCDRNGLNTRLPYKAPLHMMLQTL